MPYPAALSAGVAAPGGSGTTSNAATGYSIILPPGWVRIPLRSGTDRAVRAAARRALTVLPPGTTSDKVARQRLEMERSLRAAATTARSKGGIDIYLPVGLAYDAPVAASFLVSELSIGPASPELIAKLLLAEDDPWTAVTLDSTAGLRTERATAPQPGDGAELAYRNVNYVLPVPGRPGRWVMIAFSTPGAGNPDDELSKLLTDLFDATMATFRWELQSR